MQRKPKIFPQAILIAYAAVGIHWAHADSHCESYDDPQERNACARGHSEGARTGHWNGRRFGYTRGYLQGYAQGLVNGVNQGQNDSAYYNQGQSNEAGIDSSMAPGIQKAKGRGDSEGSAQGSSDVIARFQSAVNTGEVPSSSYNVPNTSYSPNGDAYETYVGPIQNAVQLMQSRYPQPVSFDGYDSDDEFRRPTAADLYQAGPNYDIDRDHWLDRNRGFDRWHRQGGGCDEFPTDYTPSSERKEEGGRQQQPSNSPPSSLQSINLRAICVQAYKDAYGEEEEHSFREASSESYGSGQGDGYRVGLDVGQQLSRQRGEVDSFNRKFMNAAEQAYRASFAASYLQGFEATYQDYLNHPKLSIAFSSMIDEAEGILEPGRPFSVTFTVTNSGGKGTEGLSATVAGQDVVAPRTETISIRALKSAEFTIHNVGTISPALASHQDANVQLVVGEQSTSLQSRVEHILAVQQPSAQNDYLNGKGTVTAHISNISIAKAYGAATAALYVDGQKTDSRNLGIFNAHDSASVTLSYVGRDPYALLMGGHSATVVVSINGVEMDRGLVSLDADPVSKEKNLITYFDRVANGQGIVPAGEDRGARLQDLRKALDQINEQEIQAHRNLSDENVWGKAEKITVLQLLATQYQGGRAESPGARSQYDQVAHAFWLRCNEFQKNGNLFGDKRSDQEKSYGDLCHRIVSSRL